MLISTSQKPLPEKNQYSQQTDIHAPGGIRTHILSRGAAAHPRLRPRGNWRRQLHILARLKMFMIMLSLR